MLQDGGAWDGEISEELERFYFVIWELEHRGAASLVIHQGAHLRVRIFTIFL